MPLFPNNPYYQSRIQQKHIERLVENLESSSFVVITDKYTVNACVGFSNIINVDETPLSKSMLEDYSHVIYAIDCDELGANVVADLEEWSIPFHPVRLGPDAGGTYYYHVRRDVRECLWKEHEDDTRDKITHFNHGDFCNLAQVIDMTADIDGCFVEVGTFNGASARFALRYMTMKNITRDCYFLDTFEGFNYEEASKSVDIMWAGTHKSHGYNAVTDRLKCFQTDRLHIVTTQNNIISDPLPSEVDNICVANLDVDMLEAVRSGLEKLAPRMVKGGILIVEDPGHTPTLIGARYVLNQFLERNKQFIPVVMESGQTILIKK